MILLVEKSYFHDLVPFKFSRFSDIKPNKFIFKSRKKKVLKLITFFFLCFFRVS